MISSVSCTLLRGISTSDQLLNNYNAAIKKNENFGEGINLHDEFSFFLPGLSEGEEWRKRNRKEGWGGGGKEGVRKRGKSMQMKTD